MKNLIFALFAIILISACVGSQPQATTTTSPTATTTVQKTTTTSVLADLLIEDLKVSRFASANQLEITGLVRNRGGSAVKNVGSRIEILEADTEKIIYSDSFAVVDMGPGGSSPILKYFSMPKDGNYKIVATIDPFNRIEESEENNNIASKEFSVPFP